MSPARQEGPLARMRHHLAVHRHQSTALVIHSAFPPTLRESAPQSGGLTDLRAAVRLLRHRPGFCSAIILTLAIATGAATAIFSLVNALIWQHRVATSVLVIFAAIALCLAVIGTYAVTAQAVASQRHEIGVRLALGSSYVSIVRLVFQRWLVPVAAGVLLGMLIGSAASQAVATVIGVRQSAHLFAPAAVPLILASAAAIACYIPVRRTLKRVTLTDAL